MFFFYCFKYVKEEEGGEYQACFKENESRLMYTAQINKKNNTWKKYEKRRFFFYSATNAYSRCGKGVPIPILEARLSVPFNGLNFSTTVLNPSQIIEHLTKNP